MAAAIKARHHRNGQQVPRSFDASLGRTLAPERPANKLHIRTNT